MNNKYLVQIKEQYLNLQFIKNFLNTGLYFGNSIIQMLIAIVTAPIFARYLLPEDFAIIGYFTAFVGFFNPLIHLSLYNFYSIKYFRQNSEQNRQLLFTLFGFLCIWNAIFLPVAFGVIQIIFHYSKTSFPAFPYLALVMGASFFEMAQAFVQINFRLRKNAFKYFLLESAFTVLNILISLLLVVQFKMGAEGRLGGKLIAQGIIFFVSVYILSRWWLPRVNKEAITEGIKMVLPLILGSIVVFSIRNLDRILLERVGNSYEFGYYSIGYNNAHYLILMGNALYAAFEPDVIKYVVKGKYKKLWVSITMVTLLLSTITFLFILFSEQITHYLTSGRYTRAYKYANIISIGGLFLSLNKLLMTILMAFKKTHNILILNIITTIFAYICFKLMINQYTFYGAAYARIIIGIFMTMLTLMMILWVIHKNKTTGEINQPDSIT